MDKEYEIMDLVGSKKTVVEDGNGKVVPIANKALNNNISESIRKAKEGLKVENKYKIYLNDNKENIKEELAINKEVDTIEEAMDLIKKVDFRYMFNLGLMEKTFTCEFINYEHSIAFAFKSEKEADEAVEKEMEKYPTKEIIKSGYERFGMHVRELVIKDGEMEAWISYSYSKQKYLYIIGDKLKESHYVFDIINIYQVFMHCDIKKAIQDLCELLEVKIKIIEENRRKYLIDLIYIEDKIDKLKFPALSELIKEHIPKLRVILYEGIEKLYYHQKCKDNWTFSSSMKYISGKMKKSKSNANKVVNTFALLGLLQKPDFDSGIYNKWNKNEITHFYLPEYNEVLLEKAEKVAKIMLYSGDRVMATEFSRKICKEKFGEEIVNAIFKDKVSKAKAS